MDHSTDLNCVFKVENNSNEPRNIRGIFSKAGEIQHLLPYDTGIPGEFHFFIQFQNKESAERALRSGLGLSAGLRIYPIVSSPHLIEQFRLCSTYHSRTNMKREATTGRADPPRSNHNPRIVPRESEIANKPKSYPHPIIDNSDRTYAGTGTLSDYGSTSEYLTAGTTPLPTSTPNLSITHRTTLDASQAQNLSHSIGTSLFSFSLESRLVMNILGQPFTYALSTDPEQDPGIIIELLKLSSTERGNWMIAGAHFRRIGNPQAGIAIMYAMLKVFTDVGLEENQLKPAFLLLSGCELDLAIRAKNIGDSQTSQKHYENVQMWLQKVYGASSTREPGQVPSSILSPVEAPTMHPQQAQEIGLERLQQPKSNSRSARKRRMTLVEERSVWQRRSGPAKLRSTSRKERRGSYSGNKENWRRS